MADGQNQHYAVPLYPSAARTTAQTGTDQTQLQQPAAGVGVIVVVDITAYTSGSITVTLQGKDPTSGKYYTILASAALAAAATTTLRVFPGATAAANTAANDVLPAVWRVNVAVADATSITYSIGATVLV